MSDAIETTDLPDLTMRKSDLDDWYVIERAEHDGRKWLEPIHGGMALRCSARFSDADVEGNSYEMLGLAKAIKERGRQSFKRCSVHIDGDRAYFNSPRNSQTDGVCTLAQADALADSIIAALAPEGPTT